MKEGYNLSIWRELEKIRKEELLLEMPIRKKELAALCSKYTDVIYEHILLIGIFGDSLNTLNHWATELSAFLSRINEKETNGTSSGKLKKDYYKNNLFLNHGDSINDIKSDIIGFKDLYCLFEETPTNPYILNSTRYKERTYPYFEVTNEIVNRTWEFYNLVASKMSDLMSKRNNLTTTDIKNIILSIFREIE